MSSIYKQKKNKTNKLLLLNLGNNNQYFILTTSQITECERTNLNKELTHDHVPFSPMKLYQLIVLVSHPTALPFWFSSLGSINQSIFL